MARFRAGRWPRPIGYVVGLAGLAFGCASAANEPARAPGERDGYIARPCAPLKEQAARGVPVAISLEVADVDEPIGNPIKDWLAVHPVQLNSVAHFILPLAAATPEHGPADVCAERACGKSVDGKLIVSVTSAPVAASAPVELQLERTLPDGTTRRVSVSTADQAPVLAALAGSPKQTLVVTPYYVFEPRQQSLELLLQCAARNAGPIRVGEGPESVPPVDPVR